MHCYNYNHNCTRRTREPLPVCRAVQQGPLTLQAIEILSGGSRRQYLVNGFKQLFCLFNIFAISEGKNPISFFERWNFT